MRHHEEMGGKDYNKGRLEAATDSELLVLLPQCGNTFDEMYTVHSFLMLSSESIHTHFYKPLTE